MEQIKNILFDYGAVIFEIDHQRTIEAFKGLGIAGDSSFFGHLKQHSLFDRFEVGAIGAEKFRDEIRTLIGSEITDEIIDNAWNQMLLGIPSIHLELLLQVKPLYRTFLLSNNNEIHYQWILNYLKKEFNLNGMGDYFEQDYYSHLMGMRKPNADIFEFVLQKHGLNPMETLFIDDSPQHIETAQKLGLKTHLMTKEKSLLEVLSPLIKNNINEFD